MSFPLVRDRGQERPVIDTGDELAPDRRRCLMNDDELAAVNGRTTHAIVNIEDRMVVDALFRRRLRNPNRDRDEADVGP